MTKEIKPSLGANQLLDHVMERGNLKNDAALSRALEVQPPVISKIRHGQLKVGATLLIRMHEAVDISIKEAKKFLAIDAVTA